MITTAMEYGQLAADSFLTWEQSSPFQRWACTFTRAHDCAGCWALADGRIRVASHGTHRDSYGHVADCTLIDYARNVAEVYAILGY